MSLVIGPDLASTTERSDFTRECRCPVVIDKFPPRYIYDEFVILADMSGSAHLRYPKVGSPSHFKLGCQCSPH